MEVFEVSSTGHKKTAILSGRTQATLKFPRWRTRQSSRAMPFSLTMKKANLSLFHYNTTKLTYRTTNLQVLWLINSIQRVQIKYIACAAENLITITTTPKLCAPYLDINVLAGVSYRSCVFDLQLIFQMFCRSNKQLLILIEYHVRVNDSLAWVPQPTLLWFATANGALPLPTAVTKRLSTLRLFPPPRDIQWYMYTRV